MISRNSCLAILGGTFDPVHLGHVHTAMRAAEKIDVPRVHLMPCHIPPHKAGTVTSTEHRLAMLDLVCQQYPVFSLDKRELTRDTPSYTVETLTQIRLECPDKPIYFFIGMDSLNRLDTWFEWQKLFALCHLVVYPRPGNCPQFSSAVANEVKAREIDDTVTCSHKLSGNIIFADIALMDVSSTQIRQNLAQNKPISGLVPDAIEDYIYLHNLYR